MCTRIYHWHYLSPLVPSVLSRVGAEIGPTFFGRLQKCAVFRLLRRYQLHFALVVRFHSSSKTVQRRQNEKWGLWSRAPLRAPL